VVKNHGNIIKETIKIVKSNPEDDSSKTNLFLNMRFDANYECIITVYILAQECRSAPNMPLYFVTPPEMPPSNAFRFSAGLG